MRSSSTEAGCHWGLAGQVSPALPFAEWNFSVAVLSFFLPLSIWLSPSIKVNAQNLCNLGKNSVNVCIQAGALLLILLNQLLGRQYFFFLMRIATQINIVVAVFGFPVRCVLFGLVKPVQLNFFCGRSTILPQEQSVPTSWAWFCWNACSLPAYPNDRTRFLLSGQYGQRTKCWS